MCIRPYSVANHISGEIVVPCRKCFDCRRKRAMDLRFMLDKEIEECNGVACFLTLTYDNDHLEYVYVADGISDSIELDPRKASLYYGVSEYYNSLLPRERRYIDSDPRLSYCKDFRPGLVPTFSLDMKADIRNWVKRIRIHLSRNRERYNIPSDLRENQFFKYVVVGEYGHTTLRPHWHVVITSSVLSKPMLESFVRGYCVRDWQDHFGHVDYAGVVNSSHGISSYVSKYIYKPDSLENPYLIFGAVAPPPSFHSKFLGRKYLSAVRSKFDTTVSRLVPFLSSTTAYDILHFFEISGGVSNLDDYKVVFEHKLFSDPLFIHLEELYQVLHPHVSAEFTEHIPLYYIKSFFPRKPITYKRWSYDRNVYYSETLQGHYSLDGVNFPPRVVDSECRRLYVLDVDSCLYKTYTSYLSIRFIYSHFADLQALRFDLSDLPFDSFSHLVSAFNELCSKATASRALSLERKYLSSHYAAGI